MFTVLLRSACCGVAGAVLSVPAYIVAIFVYVSRHTPPLPPEMAGKGEVGWDVLTMVHNGPVAFSVWLLAAFAIGFLLGFRYFSKRASPEPLKAI
jgi:uncharacterized membrane protein